MINNIFPELDGWDDINSNGGTIGTGINHAIHKLVIAIANLRGSTSSHLGFLENNLKELKENVDRLNENIKNADTSSTKLATALNRLTFWGIVIASMGILFAIIQFLFENKIWPFIQ